ncbi:MAG: response regulator transcription factor [Akkermansiaceae bacterium]|nr:response regulator transcription factor [Akkermansiaceae bacterium]
MPAIYLIDDHKLLLDSLSYLLENDGGYEICGQAHCAREALSEVPDIEPDLVLLDISLPDKSGLTLIKDLQALCPDVPVLVLSMHDEMLYAERVIRAGARGYVMKECASEQLLEAMAKVLKGEVALSPKASAKIFEALSGNPGDQPKLHDLTDREFEVFELIGRGEDVHDIAEHLSISPRTVDAHRTHIREKLGLPNSQALLRHAVRWVESGEFVEDAEKA